MDSRKSVLIVAQSAQIRDSLLVLLRATPQIEIIHQAEDGPSALAMGPQNQPALVLLDYDSTPKELTSDLIQLRDRWPQARYLVLQDDDQDRLQVESSGADVVLVKGVRAATILETIEGLLSADAHGPPGEGSQDGDL